MQPFSKSTPALIAALLASTVAARAEVPRVVTDTPPIHSLVSQVMGNLGTPVLLLDQGANAHSYQMRPSQAAALAEADLVVWIGPELTPWLDRAVDALGGETQRLGLLAAEGTTRRTYGEKGHDHDAGAHGAEAQDAGAGVEDHDHEHADAGPSHDEAGHDEAGHDEAGHADGDSGHLHLGTDPHAWLDPGNAEAWLGMIAADLGRLDPANATAYDANAATAQARIAALDTDIAARLAPVRGQPLVLFHDAYGYFADHYGLTIAGTVAAGDAAAPGAARLATLRADIGADAGACIFPESQHDPKLVEQIAADTGARVGGTLDPEGAGMAPGPDVYAAILTGLADTLAACFTAD